MTSNQMIIFVFEIFNNFIELLSQELILVFNNKNYDEIIRLSKTLNLNSKEEYNGTIKELKELKKQNNAFFKKDLIELNN